MEQRTKLLIERVIRQEEKKIISFLTKILADAETAGDIAQSAFLKTWEFAEREHIDNPKGFIFKTASNLAKNEIRRRVRNSKIYLETSNSTNDDLEYEAESAHPTPERCASLREDVFLITEAINGLPKKARRAFILSRFEGLSYRQISVLLDVSESSVEKYIMAALQKLRVVFANIDSDEKTDLRRDNRSGGRDRALANSIFAELSL